MAVSIDNAGLQGPRGPQLVVVEAGSTAAAAGAAGEGKGEAEVRQPVSREAVQEAGQKAEQFFQNVRRNLVFSEDSSSGRTVVSVIDSETGEIIRQIPPEQVVRIAESLGELRGLLVGERV